MKNLLIKEMKLAASPLTYLFLAFCAMAMIPQYPILVGAFFICFGLFHSFQNGREQNDVLFTVLLPVKKSDAVKAKFVFCVAIQLIAFAICFVLTIIRMTFLKTGTPYVNNSLMNANQVYLSWTLLIFALFNLVFICGFFKTAYNFGKPFIAFIIVTFLTIGIAETLHHLPGLAVLNGTDTMGNVILWMVLAAAAVVYLAVTYVSYKVSARRFEMVDM